MISDIKGSLAVQGLDLLQLRESTPGESSPFAILMDDALAAVSSAASSQEDGDTGTDSIAKNSYTGFFEEIQEKRMEELREEILEEMGLTEEMLDQMDPEARGRIETIIAKEIQERLTVQSAMEGDEEEQALQKRMLLTAVDSLSL